MIPNNITKIHIEKAINEIEENGITKGRNSSTYDVIFNGKRYPPKLIISLANKYANGKELDSHLFAGGEDTQAFRLLKKEGYDIINKKEMFYITLSKEIKNNEGEYLSAKLIICKNGFKLLKGSYIFKEPKPSFKSHSYYKMRIDFEQKSFFNKTSYEDFLQLNRDIFFESPSPAAVVVLNRAANGKTEWKLKNGLTFESFYNSSNNKNKKLLQTKLEMEIILDTTNVWIEKTNVFGRPDRNHGDRALGKALWSPQKDKRGADIYKNMRLVKPNDIIIHLINNKEISGVSIAKNSAINTNGLPGTEWNSKSYLIELKDYINLENPISRDLLLNEKNRNILEIISSNSEVFFTNKLSLRQGAYLTPCPLELANLINNIYFKLSSCNLPHFNNINLKSLNYKESNPLNIKDFKDKLHESGLFFQNILVKRYISSLVTKPFVLLSGLSGSGKTKLSQAFAQWIAEDKNQYCIIPVGADWTNREPLLGYVNALDNTEYILPENGALKLLIEANKEENKNKPYFLILDEMNLSHVERYFADFLSVMESKDIIKLHSSTNNKGIVPPNINWPKNLFIIGTVNIDETTYMFSPKVLDRANVIEFRVNKEDISNFLEAPKEIDFTNLDTKGASMGEHFVSIAANKTFPEIDTKVLNEKLVLFFEELKKTGAEFGYRTATEIHRLYNQLTTLDNNMPENTKIDIAIMQKLLPKLHGSRRKLCPVLETLASLCVSTGVNASKTFLNNRETIVYNNNDNILYPLSLEKITRMYKGAIDNGFASYAEA